MSHVHELNKLSATEAAALQATHESWCAAREAKNWEAADKLRTNLTRRGCTNLTEHGFSWRAVFEESDERQARLVARNNLNEAAA